MLMMMVVRGWAAGASRGVEAAAVGNWGAAAAGGAMKEKGGVSSVGAAGGPKQRRGAMVVKAQLGVARRIVSCCCAIGGGGRDGGGVEAEAQAQHNAGEICEGSGAMRRRAAVGCPRWRRPAAPMMIVGRSKSILLLDEGGSRRAREGGRGSPNERRRIAVGLSSSAHRQLLLPAARGEGLHSSPHLPLISLRLCLEVK